MYFRQNPTMMNPMTQMDPMTSQPPMASMDPMASQAPVASPMQSMQMAQPIPMFTYEPFVVQTLQSVMGKVLVVETVRDTLRGTLMDVKPDHIAMQVGDEVFFVRICHIVTIMPD